MKKNIKKKWLAALESGKYKQGQRHLVYGEEPDKKYCCLGVLCHLWAKEKHKKMPVCDLDGDPMPPDNVLDWAGLNRYDSHILAGVNDENDIDQFKKVIKEIEVLD